MEINLSGKTALVTGAGRGIGREIVKLLVTTGAHVVALSKTSANLESLKQELPLIETLCVDLADWNATKEALKPYSKKIDLLVNNAALAYCNKLGEITEQEIDSHYDINVKAVINVTQCVLPGMKERKSGAIVNLSSLAGLVGLQDHLVYGGTKAALNLMTSILALELGPDNIRVNAVNPGVTYTDMAMVGWSEPEKREWMISRCPLRRFSQPIDVANLVVFLLSDKANMITSNIVPIDGGIHNTKI